jgi:hypothetical protein
VAGVITEDLVDAIEVLRAARVPSRSPGIPDAIMFVGGGEVAVAAAYLDRWIALAAPGCGRPVIATRKTGTVNVVLTGPVTRRWEGLLGLDSGTD